MTTAEWIAVDWGTTRLRAWAMSGASVLDEGASDRGMGTLAPKDFEPALLELISDWLGDQTEVIACGMVGARQGWIEAPYAAVPCLPHSGRAITAPTSDPRLTVRILPGLKQDSPADVMRGEETQIAGFLALNPGWDGVVCLPGSHTKWAQVSAGEVVNFLTTMTGELLAALSGHTVLRHGLDASGWDEAAFLEAMDDTRSRPETLAARLFRIRAEGLLSGLNPVAAHSRLAGLLVGADLAAARAYWLGQPVAVIGGTGPSRGYIAGLRAQGVEPVETSADAMTRAGLIAARKTLTETS